MKKRVVVFCLSLTVLATQADGQVCPPVNPGIAWEFVGCDSNPPPLGSAIFQITQEGYTPVPPVQSVMWFMRVRDSGHHIATSPFFARKATFPARLVYSGCGKAYDRVDVVVRSQCGSQFSQERVVGTFTLPLLDSNPTVRQLGKPTGVYRKHSISATPPVIGKDLIIELENASRSCIPVWLGIGAYPLPSPVKGPNGTRWYVGSPVFFAERTRDLKAGARVRIPLAKVPTLIGFKAYAQWIYHDPCKNGWCATAALEIKVACCQP